MSHEINIAHLDAKNILAEICSTNSHDLTYTEVRGALEELRDSSNDHCLELDGNEYRIIHSDDIWDIYVEEIKTICEDCYELNLPNFMQDCVDWEKVATNCHVDGYGHTFSGYDGSELEAGNSYIFRTN